jgi:predicted RNase H-like HicB family nuclease
MSTVEINLVSGASTPNVSPEWDDTDAYHCLVVLTEEDGGYSAILANLRGVASRGDSREEAIVNIREAAAGVIESYLAAGEDIPWNDPDSAEIPEGAARRWILVNV